VELASGIHRELVLEIDMPFDLIYCSDEEWEEERSLIVNIAKKEGAIICRKCG